MDNCSRETRFAVHPFTRQIEGDEAVIGRPDTSVFLAVPVALTGRAQLHEGLGQIDEAIRDYTASLEIDPRQPLVLRLHPGAEDRAEVESRLAELEPVEQVA